MPDGICLLIIKDSFILLFHSASNYGEEKVKKGVLEAENINTKTRSV